MSWRTVRAAFACSRGLTLIELAIASVSFIVISAALGSLYLSTVRAFEEGNAQVWVQRHGSQAEAELARHMLRAVAFHGRGCGPGGTSDTRSFIFQARKVGSTAEASFHPCEFCCVFQRRQAGDTFNQLYLCSIGGLGSVGCTAGTTRNLLRGVPRNPDTGASQIGVENTTFECPSWAPCASSGYVVGATNITTAFVNVRFELCQPDTRAGAATPCTDASFPPLSPRTRFGLTATVRN